MYFEVLQFQQSFFGVLTPVHTDEGAAARRDEIDFIDLTKLAEYVGQIVFLDDFREMANPKCCGADWKQHFEN